MSSGVKKLIEEANRIVPKISVENAQAKLSDPTVLIVDVRDAPEIEKTGMIEGAIHVSRGMLEFRADPDCPYYDSRFSQDKEIIVYCASGGRSALGGKALMELGYERVANLGPFSGWVESGGATQKIVDAGM